jgi:hypothetical protein
MLTRNERHVQVNYVWVLILMSEYAFVPNLHETRRLNNYSTDASIDYACVRI